MGALSDEAGLLCHKYQMGLAARSDRLAQRRNQLTGGRLWIVDLCRASHGGNSGFAFVIGRRRWSHWTAASASRRSKLIAPGFERLALRPCPVASSASSGISFFRSALAQLRETDLCHPQRLDNPGRQMVDAKLLHDASCRRTDPRMKGTVFQSE
jgi:hypothetical protein